MSESNTQITRVGTWAVIAIAVGAGVVPALQPLLLGALLKAGRLDPVTLGHAATLESLGMAATSAFATFFLRPNNLRLLISLALATTLVAGGATMFVEGTGIVAARGLNGAANGLLLWVLVGLITRSRSPAQVFAYFITAQSIAAFVLSKLFADVILPDYDANSAYLVLLGINAILFIAAVPFAPRAFAPLAEGQSRLALPPFMGWVALFGVAAQIAAIMAFWVYAIPLAVEAGIAQETANRMISMANLGLIVAGIAVCLTASRFSPIPVVLITTGTSIAALLVTMTATDVTAWRLALFVFTFAWTFAPPFHIALLLRADPSGRAAMLVSPAQLLGMAAGPMVAAGVLSGNTVAAASIVSVAGFGASFLIALLIQFRLEKSVSGLPPQASELA